MLESTRWCHRDRGLLRSSWGMSEKDSSRASTHVYSDLPAPFEFK